MCKRLLLLVSVLLIAGTPNAFAAIGIFDNLTDIGNPLGVGMAQYVATDRYLIAASGGDIWGNADQFSYLYNEVTGNVRVSASFAWQDSGW
ncbi:MAG: hypothetical protein JW720_03730, partial [Sedimentisphaerales bacterium]|nr:hypothetical protein [Sedimentisphaerales bacterium]